METNLPNFDLRFGYLFPLSPRKTEAKERHTLNEKYNSA